MPPSSDRCFAFGGFVASTEGDLTGVRFKEANTVSYPKDLSIDFLLLGLKNDRTLILAIDLYDVLA